MTTTPNRHAPGDLAGSSGGPVPPALLIDRADSTHPGRRRGSIALRQLLVLPHLAVLLVRMLAGYVAFLGGFCAALTTGQVPTPIARYLGGCIGYAARVTAYNWLLTDRYPPFALPADGDDYPVVIEIELAPGRLTRAAVLFRWALALPAVLLSGVTAAGWAATSAVIWLVTLVAGRMPASLVDATTAVLRFNVRVTAYWWLVTSTYPRGLFGDQRRNDDESAAHRGTGLTWPVPPAAGPPAGPGSAQPAGSSWATPAALRSGLPRELLLSAAAKRLVALFVVLGMAVLAADGALAAANHTTTAPPPAIVTVTPALARAASSLADQVGQAGLRRANCFQTLDAPAVLACEQDAARQYADAFDIFAAQVDQLEPRLPVAAHDKAAAVIRSGHELAIAYRALSDAHSIDEYADLATGPTLTTTERRFSMDYLALLSTPERTR